MERGMACFGAAQAPTFRHARTISISYPGCARLTPSHSLPPRGGGLGWGALHRAYTLAILVEMAVIEAVQNARFVDRPRRNVRLRDLLRRCRGRGLRRGLA